jgi:glycosyltransferase involved in cell wall biosynthesis
MPKRPTILINHLMEPPNRISGVTRFLFALLHELSTRAAFDYVLLTTWDADKLPEAVAKSGIRVKTRPFHNSTPLNILSQLVVVPLVMRQTGAAIEFNCNSTGCFWPNWPRVTTIHDFYFDLLPDKYPFRHRLWWQLFLPVCMAAASEVICVSENTRDDLCRFYPRFGAKGIVVHEAGALIVDPSGGGEICKLSAPYAVYVGNISPNKNPEVLARALQLLARKGKPASVYHVGLDDKSLLDQAVKTAGVAGQLHSLGALSDRELGAAYAGAHCMVVTSTHEGFCLPVIEAQICGAPVVCSDIPVLREVAGKGALFFDPHDAEDLAACLEKVFGDSDLRQRLVIFGRQNAARFSWARAAEKMEAIFLSLSNSQHGHGRRATMEG